MKSFIEFLTKRSRFSMEDNSGFSVEMFTHAGPMFLILVCAVIALVTLLVILVLRRQSRCVRVTYFSLTAIPITWGVAMTTLGVFRVLDQFVRGAGQWADGMGELQSLPRVLSEILVMLLTGSAVTAIFLIFGLLLPARKHESAKSSAAGMTTGPNYR